MIHHDNVESGSNVTVTMTVALKSFPVTAQYMWSKLHLGTIVAYAAVYFRHLPLLSADRTDNGSDHRHVDCQTVLLLGSLRKDNGSDDDAKLQTSLTLCCAA